MLDRSPAEDGSTEAEDELEEKHLKRGSSDYNETSEDKLGIAGSHLNLNLH